MWDREDWDRAIVATERYMSKMKLCIDCKHYSFRREYSQLYPGSDTIVDKYECDVFSGMEHPVMGWKITKIECETLRLGPCGFEAKFWEEKKVTPLEESMKLSREKLAADFFDR